ncbi:MAG TPA: hypothetical protein VGD41_10535, partial [Pyrinomonadaceae bacterium]
LNIYCYTHGNPATSYDRNGQQASGTNLKNLPPWLQNKMVATGQATRTLRVMPVQLPKAETTWRDTLLNIVMLGTWSKGAALAESGDTNYEAVSASPAFDDSSIAFKMTVTAGMVAGDVTGGKDLVEGLAEADTLRTTKFDADQSFEKVVSGTSTLMTEVVIDAATEGLMSHAKGKNFAPQRVRAPRDSAATRAAKAYEQGSINVPEGKLYLQSHSTSGSVRDALGVPSSSTKIPGYSGFQSAHVIPKDVGELLGNYNYNKAKTLLLPESVHGAFDQGWINAWQKMKASGKPITRSEVQKLLEDAVDKATIKAGSYGLSVDTPAFSPEAAKALKTRIGAEFDELGIKMNDVIYKP